MVHKDGFVKVIPVFVISLLDSVDRRLAISHQLQSNGIGFRFVNAIDGRKGLPQEHIEDIVQGAISIHTAQKVSDVEFACALSHIKAYRMIVKENIQWALILEDDAVVLPDLLSYLEEEYFKTVEFTSLIYGQPARVCRFGKKHVFNNYHSYLIHPQRRVTSTGAYVLSKSVAKLMAENATPVCEVADWPHCFSDLARAKRCRLLYPPLVEWSTAESIIDASGRQDVEPTGKRRFLGVHIPPARRIFKSIVASPRKLILKKLP